MTEAPQYEASIDPRRNDVPALMEAFGSRYGTTAVALCGQQDGLHLKIKFKSERLADCGCLEEVQGSNWKIVHAGVTSWAASTREREAFIEIREVTQHEQ